jgi:hypothetical protein
VVGRVSAKGIAEEHLRRSTALIHGAHAAACLPSTTSSPGSSGGRPGSRCLGAGPRYVNSLNWKLTLDYAPDRADEVMLQRVPMKFTLTMMIGKDSRRKETGVSCTYYSSRGLLGSRRKCPPSALSRPSWRQVGCLLSALPRQCRALRPKVCLPNPQPASGWAPGTGHPAPKPISVIIFTIGTGTPPRTIRNTLPRLVPQRCSTISDDCTRTI